MGNRPMSQFISSTAGSIMQDIMLTIYSFCMYVQRSTEHEQLQTIDALSIVL
jgi:hypothetical protein